MRTPSEAAGADIDIDVTPVMNMFVILIPFLVSMAVFTHVSILEFSLPPNVGAGMDPSEGKPKLKATIVVAPSFLAITHGENLLDSIPVGPNGEYQLEELETLLGARRETMDIRDEAIVAVRDAVRFKHVVAVMDRIRAVGFDKVGLSSATSDPEEA
jgi:biopolymer transport protein ExbD